jgi:hypothetical protein
MQKFAEGPLRDADHLRRDPDRPQVPFPDQQLHFADIGAQDLGHFPQCQRPLAPPPWLDVLHGGVATVRGGIVGHRVGGTPGEGAYSP